MDRKHTSLLKLQELRDKVRLTEEAHMRQEKLRKEYEEKTEKLIAENDKISTKLLAKQKTARKYKDLVDNLMRQKAELEKKLHMLLEREQKQQKYQCENVVESMVTTTDKKAGPKDRIATNQKYQYENVAESMFTTDKKTGSNDSVQSNQKNQFENVAESKFTTYRKTGSNDWVQSNQKNQCEDIAESMMTPNKPTTYRPKTEADDVSYDGEHEEIWELKRSIAEIQSQLEDLEKKKESDD